MNQQSIHHPRRPLIAASLSTALPGLGQLYNGDINKANYFFLAFLAITLGALPFAVLYPPIFQAIDAVLLIPIAYLLLWSIAVIHAFVSARKKTNYITKSWQGLGTYLLIFLIFQVVVTPLLSQYIKANFVESFKIPSGSMEPNLYRGDMLFVDKRYNCAGCQTPIQRGDVSVFIYPNDRTSFFIKRVIGLPNDYIKIQGGEVYINNQLLTHNRYQHSLHTQKADTVLVEKYGQQAWNIIWKHDKTAPPDGEYQVPAGHIFVLGDNRAASNDSRAFGMVPMSDVIGKAKFVWMSINYDTGQINWNRLGHIIDYYGEL